MIRNTLMDNWAWPYLPSAITNCAPHTLTNTSLPHGNAFIYWNDILKIHISLFCFVLETLFLEDTGSYFAQS